MRSSKFDVLRTALVVAVGMAGMMDGKIASAKTIIAVDLNAKRLRLERVIETMGRVLGRRGARIWGVWKGDVGAKTVNFLSGFSFLCVKVKLTAIVNKLDGFKKQVRLI